MAVERVKEQLTFGSVALAFALAVGGGTLGAMLGTSHKRLCAYQSGRGNVAGCDAVRHSAGNHGRSATLAIVAGAGFGLRRIRCHQQVPCFTFAQPAASHFDEATTHRFSEIASAMMLALAIHCTVDGLAMTAGSEAFTAGYPRCLCA